MNTEMQLKLQAYLDGELAASQVQQVEEWLAKDAESQALLAGLRQVKDLLKSNELPAKFPVSGEFFWTQIQRQITQPEVTPAPVRRHSWVKLLLRWLVPATGLALLLLAMFPVRNTRENLALGTGMEVETALPNLNVITFRSDAEGISVVWVDPQ